MRFNVRVYGLLIENECVLLSEELIRGKKYTKFPGGGLEFGEGLHDCLKREFVEELNWEIDITGHFYTTDFFVPSAFDDSQIISVYYRVQRTVQSSRLQAINSEHQNFVWMPIAKLDQSQLNLPIDKHVAQMLHGN